MLQWGRSNYAAEMHRNQGGGGGGMNASMGPQQLRCGNAGMGFSSSGVMCSFNGAAAITLRKCGRAFPVFVNGKMLQWGRSNYAAEITFPPRNTRASKRASMGPQQLRCGNKRNSKRPAIYYVGFNGAAAITLRKWPPPNVLLALALEEGLRAGPSRVSETDLLMGTLSSQVFHCQRHRMGPGYSGSLSRSLRLDDHHPARQDKLPA